MHRKPKRFHVSIGGHMGPSYSVQRVHDELLYKSCEQSYANWKSETIPVTDKQWGTFRTAIDSLDVWCWEREYLNPGVCDGTQWSVDIAYADKRIRSHGCNNYPTGDANGSGGPEKTENFDRFISAIQFLVGSRDFQ